MESQFLILSKLIFLEQKILDAFAGTGALGKAISRGAKGAVIFIEKNHLAQKILAENLQITEKNPKSGTTKLVRSSISGWLNSTRAV